MGIPLKNIISYEACALGKITKASFKSKNQQAKRPFEELHLDLIGPISPTSREGDKYILTVVDRNMRYCSAARINQKSDVFSTLSTILNFKAKRFGNYPSVLHSDISISCLPWLPNLTTISCIKLESIALMHSHCAVCTVTVCTVTVPKNLNMKICGVWMVAWLEHAACQLQAVEQVFSCSDVQLEFSLSFFLSSIYCRFRL
ncbi:hypothetical protein VP01_9159g1 [Puccinia sorghi]|uniref:Integrase catalytic domain-containing protein n=1 Tax=Puccinia sorghi TaxID=27349 RepID=A0A0L6U7I5_9BASI|nr:hypothetical protein VP01_9159g1 [Puccinia sorghi]